MGRKVNCERSILDQALKPLLKQLPRRIFDQDRDQTWNLSLDGPWIERKPMQTHAIGKVVPIYQSGWEGCGIWMNVRLPKDASLDEVAAAMIADAKAKIMADADAIGFVGVKA